MKSEAMAAQLAYWKGKLQGAPAVLDLPFDRPRPARQTYRGTNYPLDIPEPLTASLKTLARGQGATLYMVLLAAFQTLLHRYTAQDDIVVGSPIANRTRVEMENIFGFFVNTLVMRADFSGDPTFRTLLAQVRETTLDAYEHQALPFEKLVEELHPERDLGRNPLFQVMFVLQNAPMQRTSLPDIVTTFEDLDGGTATFDLTMSLHEEENRLCGVINYNTDLFEAETVSRMAGHFRTLLESIVASPEQPVSTLTLLTEAERYRILREWNDTKADYPRDRCIHELFEQQVEKTPDLPAVIFEDRQLTYAELNRRANRLAHYLRDLGAGPDIPVGIYAERSLEMVIGILGILKAGAAYVPLDPSYPEERLSFMLADTGALLILTQGGLLERIPPNKAQVISLDKDWYIIEEESPENLRKTTSAENLASVIYTSGTTGVPKGVMVRHRSVCNFLFWKEQTLPLTHADRVLQKASLSFDASISEIFSPLSAGAQLVLARPGAEHDSAYLARLIREDNITAVNFVPSILKLFLAGLAAEKCGSLRRLGVGGEALSAALQEECHRILDVALYNCYGPTETTIAVTYWSCERGDASPTVPIGKPIVNTEIYILDRHMQPVPVGVAGEIYIGGEGVSRGYLNRPELTTEKFVHDPFGARPGARLYKTGDMARYRADGNIEFLGRLDHQVKVGGVRIELGEIESTLERHNDVQECVVVSQQERLAAYLVPRTGSLLTSHALRTFLRKKLPLYMLPSSYIFLDELPLTSSGKVDRKALPAFDEMTPEREKDFIPPRTPTEKVVEKVWSSLLSLDRVSVHDSFFDLGGSSLLAMQAASRLGKELGIELGVRALFENVTIAELAGLIEETLKGKSSQAGAEERSRADEDDGRERGAL
jgi:amino acid adenylation domain-containing protein